MHCIKKHDGVFCYMENILPGGRDYYWLDIPAICLSLSPLLLETEVNFHFCRGVQ